MNDFRNFKMLIAEKLKERKSSKNKICAKLNLSQPNFNKYCQSKLCSYLECKIENLIDYVPNKKKE